MLGYRERIPSTDPRLGRSVNHDEQSRRYAFRAPERTVLRAVRHQRHVPIYDQGNTGSCTGMAAVGCMATGAYFPTVDAADAPWLQPLGEPAALRCYSDATRIDPWPGTYLYPPDGDDTGDDTGSDGLSVAKVLQAAGAVSGYTHAFNLDAALAALMDRPLITGTYWLRQMFYPSAEGLVTPGGVIDGGHEYVMDGYDPTRGWVWFTNSWGLGFGVDGRFAMEAEKYGALLAQDGDVTVFTPSTQPAPEPEPGPVHDPADVALWDGPVGQWARKKSRFYRSIREDICGWADVKGL